MKRKPLADTFTASRKGGGSYKRPARWYRAKICLACAAELLKRVTPGHDIVNHWSIRALRDGIERRTGEKSAP